MWDIWQDIGLDDWDNESSEIVPRWLGDEDVRSGIRALLDLDRCCEEERRISSERTALQAWVEEEWASCNEAYRAGMSYHWHISSWDAS